MVEITTRSIRMKLLLPSCSSGWRQDITHHFARLIPEAVSKSVEGPKTFYIMILPCLEDGVWIGLLSGIQTQPIWHPFKRGFRMVTFLACLYINILYTGCVVKRCLNKIWVGRCIGVSYLLVGGPRKRPPFSARNPSQMAFGTTAWVWWVSWKRRRVKVDFFRGREPAQIQNRFGIVLYTIFGEFPIGGLQ